MSVAVCPAAMVKPALTIRETQPRVILFECEHAGPLASVPAVQLLAGLEYELFVVSRDLFRPGIDPVDATPEMQGRGDDVVAVHRSQLACVAALVRNS